MIRLLTSIDGPRSVRMFATSFAFVATCVSFDALAEPTAAERSLAAALFDQGRTLMTEGKIDEACIKLSESQRLDPGGGTLLNLALCHEKQGKIATAWTEFREARAIAKKDNRPDRESAADGEIAKLEPQLSKVSVVVTPDNKVPGMTVEIDSLPLPEAAWGTPFPVDPGPRIVVVKAPGYREWKTTVEIGTTAKNADVNIPKLEKSATSTPNSTGASKTDGSDSSNSSANVAAPDKPAARTSTMRKAGFIIGGIGVGFLGVGAIAGAAAISANNDVKKACPDPDEACTDLRVVEKSQGAVSLGNLSTATFLLGAAGLATGAILVMIAPKNAPAKAAISVGPQSVFISGKF